MSMFFDHGLLWQDYGLPRPNMGLLGTDLGYPLSNLGLSWPNLGLLLTKMDLQLPGLGLQMCLPQNWLLKKVFNDLYRVPIILSSAFLVLLNMSL